MHSRITNIYIVTALFGTFVPAPSSAQTIPSPFRFVDTRQEAGLFVGTSSMAKGRFGFGPAGGVHMGARWGIELSGPLGFETVAGAISGTRDVINPAKVVGDLKIGEADVVMGVVDARLRFTLTGDRTWHRLAPFIVAGGGIVFDVSPTAVIDDELLPDDRFDGGTSFFGTTGAGARLLLTDRFAIRGDGVFSLMKINTPPGFSDTARGFPGVEKSEWVSGLHLTLALVARF
jgi:hypothetical protein